MEHRTDAVHEPLEPVVLVETHSRVGPAQTPGMGAASEAEHWRASIAFGR